MGSSRIAIHAQAGVVLLTALAITGCLQPARKRTVVETQLVNPEPTGAPTPTSTATPPPVVQPLAITPATATVALGGSITFAASGGTPPYAFTSSGTESVSTAGLLRPGTASGARDITVRDSKGLSAVAKLTITVPAARTPNDPMLSQQASLFKATNDIDAVGAWGISTNCKAKIVAVLDTGIDLNHPDLMANIWVNPAPTRGDSRGWNFVGDNGDATDQNYHGTHVAGTIGAVGNNGQGVSGVCWQANILPIKFLDEDGGGTVSDAVAAIDYAVSVGAKILSNSWGVPTDSQALRDAIQRANTQGALFVVASGNGNAQGVGFNIDTTPAPPASFDYPNIVAVGAVNNSDVLAAFSNFGVARVHLAAPGVSVLSTYPSFRTAYMVINNETYTPYERLNGTSMATPHVAAAIALLWSSQPGLTAAQVKARVLAQADKLPGLAARIMGGNRLNVKRLLVD
ncbi:MAG TPA: S8 family peptidase [Bdellovibrionota bacterium]|nr:S8 family peptidase [Bdellovibrionota bacterium]